MFKDEPLIRRQQRKAALLRESAALRLALVREAQELRTAATWVDLGLGVVRGAQAGWTAVAPFLSWGSRQKPESAGFVHRLAGAVSLARSIMAVWRNWR